ncbi:hypothetical protein J4228_00300 [Candidatus Woesearchaeota archaeon]|nr:hypothetical protein [Candidatus Woesearchaeota archaeon]
MKKGVFAVLSLLFVVLVLAGCAPKELSEEEQKALEAELNQLSDEELDQAIKAVETKDTGALAGQAYYKKLPTVQSKIPKIGSPTLPKDTFLDAAKKVQQARVKGCAPGPTGKIKCETEYSYGVDELYAVKEFQNVDCSKYSDKDYCGTLKCMDGIGCCKNEFVVGSSTCNGNIWVNQTKNKCTGVITENIRDCSNLYGTGKTKFTCKTPQVGPSGYFLNGCQGCGSPICEKDGEKQAPGFGFTCDLIYPKGTWKDTGEVVTGPGCQ